MARFLPDTNVWLALTIDGHPHHGVASDWLESTADRDEVLFCRATQQSVLRLLTTTALFVPLGATPLTNVEAWAVFDALVHDRRVSLLGVEPEGMDRRWRRFSGLAKSSPKRWMDAYLAAFAVAADSILVTTDRAYVTAYEGLEVALLGAD